MAQYSEELIDETLALWQPRCSEELTREDARQILENVTGFFRILIEWDAASREGEGDDSLGETVMEGEADE